MLRPYLLPHHDTTCSATLSDGSKCRANEFCSKHSSVCPQINLLPCSVSKTLASLGKLYAMAPVLSTNILMYMKYLGWFVKHEIPLVNPSWHLPCWEYISTGCPHPWGLVSNWIKDLLAEPIERWSTGVPSGLSVFGPLLSWFAAIGFWSLCKSSLCLLLLACLLGWRNWRWGNFSNSWTLRHLMYQKSFPYSMDWRWKQISLKSKSKLVAFRHLNQKDLNG